MCDIGTPYVCNNQVDTDTIKKWKDMGKKVIISFGGAGMGGSWDGVNRCWDHCFGREDEIVSQLGDVVDTWDLDGVDLDYEYFYEDNAQFGFTQGTEAQTFIKQMTLKLREGLGPDKIIAHAPMDADIAKGTKYYDILKEVASSLTFIMPQYYNGVTFPVTNGLEGGGALQHYTDLVEDVFGGDATKVVFGFCLTECGSYDASSSQAKQILSDLAVHYPCNGGAFYWSHYNEFDASWSSVVSEAIAQNAEANNC